MLLLDAFGAHWRLDASGLEPHLAGRLEELWGRARTPVGGDEIGSGTVDFVVTRAEDGQVVIDGVAATMTDEEVPYAVSRALTYASILRRTGTCLMLHAAGLAAPDGATVALVAASGTGKTTAARTLGQHLGYVSDETIAVEHDLTVRSHPKPLSVVIDPAAPRTKSEHSPDELGLLRAPERLHLAAVVVLERTADVDEPVLEPMGLVDAIDLVLPQSSALATLDRPLDRLAVALTRGHGPWRLRYREIADCVGLVTDLAAGMTPGGVPELVTWEWIDGAAQQDPGDFADDDIDAGTLVVRGRYDDALSSDGSVLVLNDRWPSNLPGLAATLWLAAAEPLPIARLVDEAVAVWGPHPESEALVLDTVRSLIRTAVLRSVAARD